jgi:hypothetical protein
MKMKYVVRRLVWLTPIITLAVSALWFAMVAGLIALGAEPTNTPFGVWLDGLGFGLALSVAFALYGDDLVGGEK